MRKILVSIIILFFIINIIEISEAKYIIEYKTTIASINLDKTKPYIQIKNILKDKITHQIIIRINIIENNILENNLNCENLILKVKDKELSSPKNIKITEVSKNEKRYYI